MARNLTLNRTSFRPLQARCGLRGRYACRMCSRDMAPAAPPGKPRCRLLHPIDTDDIFSCPQKHLGLPGGAAGARELYTRVVSYYRMCSLSTECIPFLYSMFSSYRMCPLTIWGGSGALEGHHSFQKIRRSSNRKTSMLTSNRR